MSYRSNAAEAWYPDPQAAAAQEIPLDLLPPTSLTQPLWRSLVGNLRDTLAPEKLPPLQLTSRPVNVGLALGERLRLPWFRTVFTNIGDVLSPETLPPLELESQPVDVGELVTDQLSHFWWGSLLRNLADRVAPESQPALNLTAKPILDIIPKSWILLPMWSEVVDTPKVFYPDKPKPTDAARPVGLQPVALPADKREALVEALVREPTAADLLRDIRRSRIRQRIWIGLATAQILYMVLAAAGKL
ncbi:MAG TPA: hypothetical protein VJW96_09165 [Terriglobales bacterium]|jgi:hypothetical protein|nr:hypothetical protein [Terriglobales bacterium]